MRSHRLSALALVALLIAVFLSRAIARPLRRLVAGHVAEHAGQWRFPVRVQLAEDALEVARPTDQVTDLVLARQPAVGAVAGELAVDVDGVDALGTADVEHGTEIAQRELQAGCCFVNDFVRSDPRYVLIDLHTEIL